LWRLARAHRIRRVDSAVTARRALARAAVLLGGARGMPAVSALLQKM